MSKYFIKESSYKAFEARKLSMVFNQFVDRVKSYTINGINIFNLTYKEYDNQYPAYDGEVNGITLYNIIYKPHCIRVNYVYDGYDACSLDDFYITESLFGIKWAKYRNNSLDVWYDLSINKMKSLNFECIFFLFVYISVSVRNDLNF